MDEPWTTTCIRIRRDVLDAMRDLAERKRRQRGGLGRASVSALLSDLTVRELERVAGQAKRKKEADA